MKVRFYCDVPSNGIYLSGTYSWALHATNKPSGHSTGQGYTRVAFDVDMPPNLILPPHDLMAPAEKATVIEVGKYNAEENT